MWSSSLSVVFGSALLVACPSASVPEPPTPEPTPAEPSWIGELQFSTSTYSRPVAGADLNGDGVRNLVAASGGDSIHVLGSPLTTVPSVAHSRTFPGLDVRPSPIAGDLNGDGDNDLFLYDPTDGKLMLWYGPLAVDLGDPDWVFDAGDNSRFGAAGRLLDLDADGDQDLLVGGPGTPGPECGEEGSGTLLFRMPITSGPLQIEDADTIFKDPAGVADCDGWFVDAFDANADGTLDVLIGNRIGGARVYFGPIADGTLTHADADVYLGDSVTGTWFWNDGRGIPGGALLGYGQPGDVVALGMAFVPSPLIGPSITPADSASIWVTPSSAFGPVRVASGDWDGDGEADAAMVAEGGAEVSVVRGPLSEFSARVAPRITLSGATGTLFAADVDGDGREELVTGDESAGLQVWRVRLDPPE